MLHEFGHVLGLIHEHQNPNANIPWNTNLVEKELSGPPNFWDEETIRYNIFRKYPSDVLGEYRDFDPKSIMAYFFAPAWTRGLDMGNATELSPSDKALVSRIYPGKG
jgi:hypothetical protein